jgi:hypothetical protein
LEIDKRGDGIAELWLALWRVGNVLSSFEFVVLSVVESCWVGTRLSIHLLIWAGFMITVKKAQVVCRYGGYDTNGDDDNDDSEHVLAILTVDGSFEIDEFGNQTLRLSKARAYDKALIYTIDRVRKAQNCPR